MPGGRAEKVKATRTAILSAAEAEFCRRGYFATDSNTIARRAGYAPGTFYLHFKDKLDVFLAVYQQLIRREWLGMADRAKTTRSGRPAADALTDAFRFSIGFRLKTKRFRLALDVLRQHEPRVDQVYWDRQRALVRTVGDLFVALGANRPRDAEIAANLVRHGGYMHQLMLGEARSLGLSRDLLVRDMVNGALKMLRPARAAPD